MKKVLTTTIIILLGIYAIGKNGFSNKNIHFATGNIVDSNDYYIYHIDSINNTYIISAVYYGDTGPAQTEDMGPGITESLGHFPLQYYGYWLKVKQ